MKFPVVAADWMPRDLIAMVGARQVAFLNLAKGTIHVADRPDKRKEIMDERYPDRSDRRSQAGKTPYCIMREHANCRRPETCACPCHDDQELA